MSWKLIRDIARAEERERCQAEYQARRALDAEQERENARWLIAHEVHGQYSNSELDEFIANIDLSNGRKP